MQTVVRPMTDGDVEAARDVQNESFADYDRRHGHEPTKITDEVAQRQSRRFRHFLVYDRPGAWVAEDDGRVVGVTLASRRDRLWGLSLLAVSPMVQGHGVGGRLLDAALSYARADDTAVILSSSDVRAMHRYASAGFDLHPQIRGHGEVLDKWLPHTTRVVRDGTAAHRALLDTTDAVVRGSRRGPDHDILPTIADLFVVDDADGQGYAYLRPSGQVETVVATDDDTATTLLWHCLRRTNELGVNADVDHVNAGQQWAVRVLVEAHLSMAPMGPVFWRGRTPPPSYLPTGAYL